MSKEIPAYPSGESYTTFNNVTGVTSQHGKSPLHTGMTLRDHFAALAMQGILPMDDDIDFKYISSVAYGMADAMIRERNKQNERPL